MVSINVQSLTEFQLMNIFVGLSIGIGHNSWKQQANSLAAALLDAAYLMNRIASYTPLLTSVPLLLSGVI